MMSGHGCFRPKKFTNLKRWDGFFLLGRKEPEKSP